MRCGADSAQSFFGSLNPPFVPALALLKQEHEVRRTRTESVVDKNNVYQKTLLALVLQNFRALLSAWSDSYSQSINFAFCSYITF